MWFFLTIISPSICLSPSVGLINVLPLRSVVSYVNQRMGRHLSHCSKHPLKIRELPCPEHTDNSCECNGLPTGFLWEFNLIHLQIDTCRQFYEGKDHVSQVDGLIYRICHNAWHSVSKCTINICKERMQTGKEQIGWRRKGNLFGSDLPRKSLWGRQGFS